MQYLLGKLTARYLTTLREFGGLQAYPSRTKDPDPVDFSTGSVGLGAAAPLFAALADALRERPLRRAGRAGRASSRCSATPSSTRATSGRPIARDALRGPRQRAVDRRPEPPEPRPGHPRHPRRRSWRRCSAAAAGTCSRPSTAAGCRRRSRRPGGEALRRRIDEMPNEEYQGLIRRAGDEIRERLARPAPTGDARCACGRSSVPDDELPGAARRPRRPRPARAAARRSRRPTSAPTAPTVLFAYTIKGWGLPFAGDPLNHSALLTDRADRRAARALGHRRRRRVGPLRPGLARGPAVRGRRPSGCAAIAAGSAAAGRRPIPTVGRRAGRTPPTSTQEAFGRVADRAGAHAGRRRAAS